MKKQADCSLVQSYFVLVTCTINHLLSLWNPEGEWTNDLVGKEIGKRFSTKKYSSTWCNWRELKLYASHIMRLAHFIGEWKSDVISRLKSLQAPWSSQIFILQKAKKSSGATWEVGLLSTGLLSFWGKGIIVVASNISCFDKFSRF